METTKTCNYCGRICKNDNSLRQHEIRCKSNPCHIICYGNRGNMPKHIRAYYIKNIKLYNGDVLDITGSQLEEYMKVHTRCEICGKNLEESISSKSKYHPKRLCIDHNHDTSKFRGILCSRCNRQLGWYEKFSQEINDYLNK